MTAQPSPDLPDSPQRPCRAQYPQSPNPMPHTRIIRCHLSAGHPGEHEEADTEVTWLDPPTPQYAQGGIIPRCPVKRTNGIAVSRCTLRVDHEGAHLSYWSSDDPDVLLGTLPDDEDEEFSTPDVGYPTASDLALVAYATGGHHGAISVEYLPAPDDDDLPDEPPKLAAAAARRRQYTRTDGQPAGEDVYQAAAGKIAAAIRAAVPDEDECLADEDECFRTHPIHLGASTNGVVWMVYAAVDGLAELAARAAVDEAVRLTEQRVRAEIAADRDDWKTRCEQAWTQLDQAEADLAAMTAESAEARATTRTLCNTCGHEEFTPTSKED